MFVGRLLNSSASHLEYASLEQHQAVSGTPHPHFPGISFSGSSGHSSSTELEENELESELESEVGVELKKIK